MELVKQVMDCHEALRISISAYLETRHTSLATDLIRFTDIACLTTYLLNDLTAFTTKACCSDLSFFFPTVLHILLIEPWGLFLYSIPCLYSTLIFADSTVHYSTIVFCPVLLHSTTCKSYGNKSKVSKLEFPLTILYSEYCNVHTIYDSSFSDQIT